MIFLLALLVLCAPHVLCIRQALDADSEDGKVMCAKENDIVSHTAAVNKSQTRGNSCSYARLWVRTHKEQFQEILDRGNVDISEDGTVIIKSNNGQIPFEGIGGVKERMQAYLLERSMIEEGKNVTPSYAPTIKNDRTTQETMDDLKSLLEIVGVKKIYLAGYAGGDWAEGGKHYEEGAEFQDGWYELAWARNNVIQARLGLPDDKVKSTGYFSKQIGVEIQAITRLKVSAFKREVDITCNGKTDRDILPPDEIAAQLRRILYNNNNIAFKNDEVTFVQFVENNIPFEVCQEKVFSRKIESECIPGAKIKDGAVANVKKLVKDLADFSEFADVQGMMMVGFSNPGVDIDKSEASALKEAFTKLGAKRASIIAGMIASYDKPIKEFAQDAKAAFDTCVGDYSQCNAVSKFGKVAVYLRVNTLMDMANV